MLEPQARKTKRDIVRGVFTAPRVGLLSWAFAAVIMGTIGFASFQFGAPSFSPSFAVPDSIPAGSQLPSGTSPETTASTGQMVALPIPDARVLNQDNEAAKSLEQSQIEVLQREVVGLRRRLTALTEQNLAYSRRIAALEREAATAKLANAEFTALKADDYPERALAPRPGKIVSQAPRPQVGAATETPVPSGEQANSRNEPSAQTTLAETSEVSGDTVRSEPPRRIETAQKLPPPVSVPGPDVTAQEPVRIVAEPSEPDAPLTTGSIPPVQSQQIEPFNTTPTRTRLAPKVITPSDPAGRLRSGGEGQIKRSDFGAVIGHYRSRAGAAKAWADFKEQNEERMRDLRPLLMEKQTEEGGIALMIGPFANAADAAVACLHLLDVTELCRPALYAGDPLVTAAEFRDSAF
ncbi:hypothetical protein [uncultured Roseibium sp.]|uniref:hypothetical protein n=1 Tax=uncultured Roseibium sp. TaxID=1936171 RepID=UPI00263487F8|nr:hypothetical protein [uncultured Roseibium sp.]